jgi:hypothetical protein
VASTASRKVIRRECPSHHTLFILPPHALESLTAD